MAICKLYLHCKEKSYIHVYKFYIGIPTPFCRRSIWRCDDKYRDVFVVNTIILGLNFSCKIKSAVLHAAFLTLIVGISEILVNLLITYITDDYTAYMDSFSAFVSLVVFSKLLYFS